MLRKAAQAKHASVEAEPRYAKLAFDAERTDCECDVAAAQTTIGALRADLQSANCHAKLAFGTECADRERDVAAAQATIGALRAELQTANQRITAQNTLGTEIWSLSDELRQAKTTMQTQHNGIENLGDVTDEMFDLMNELTAGFHEIVPSEKSEGNDNGDTSNVVSDAVNVDGGAPVHAQSTPMM